MAMKLRDSDGRKLREGIYMDDDLPSYTKYTKFYRVFYNGKWKAEDANGKVYTLDYPPNMPDSALMPDGKLRVDGLKHVSKDKLHGILEGMVDSVSKRKKAISLLARCIHH